MKGASQHYEEDAIRREQAYEIFGLNESAGVGSASHTREQ